MAAGALPMAMFLALLCVGVVRGVEVDTLTAGRSLTVGHTLVSSGRKFALGFFQPEGGATGSWYIGIWYLNMVAQTPVWVANRDTPISDPASSRLAIAPDGNLALFDDSGSIAWSTKANTSGIASATDTVAVLHDSGNLVLSPASNASAVLWQSFDHLGDTWLPGGKLRRDKRTSEIQGMVSWRARGDPAPGMYALQLDPSGAPQYVMQANGTREYWLSGNWTGKSFTGAPEVTASGLVQFVDNDDEIYFTYSFAANTTTVYRFVMDVSGQLKGLFWVEATQAWNLVYAAPKARCTVPRGCGAFGVCTEGAATTCDCARGFRPRSPPNWASGDYTNGCMRNTQLQCAKNSTAAGSNKAEQDKFLRMDGTRFPDDGKVAGAASIGDCQSACLGHCTCSAYAYNGSCFLWHGNLQNLQAGVADDRAGAGRLYLRLAASELPGPRGHKWRDIKIASGALAIACFLVAASILLVHTIRKRRAERVNGLTVGDGYVSYKYSDLQYVTKNFTDKIGAGAFGSVFKGQFSDSTVVAVKKLEGFRQGEKQFRAEVSTLGSIQHVNLIRMLGFCSDGGADRKLLVYEYMPNGSLDHHLFRKTFYVLSWQVRYQVALGVAKGLAYLHERCRDCIIHCDVKPENILLDAAFAPKVGDFGLAKLLGRDSSRVLTSMRGTIGYLAPEWISGEAITAKADVFSYGMMLFEIVSGRRNVEGESQFVVSSTGSTSTEEQATTTTTTFFPLLVARRLAEEGEVMALLDPELEGDANAEEMKRVCKVACWCIQHDVNARPTMAEVVQVLHGLTDVEMPPLPQYLEVLAGRQRVGAP
ncbi:G-type lectin S-receptor-like serine/threonine-protein kinase At2g19130 [Lolium perenne]|uniref:G-type lectin S-receptor-like serine/threonine-protein kinase At2g19130 n=1 Tax=Lolium perenne TaxID=4522 RepID=UPI0021F502BB|nr:G-type lectin S-receptor-like serine/threonine-protein kinase At2g19130 [Lolium perenne]